MTEQQKHEISTVADRTITVRLSDADCERLTKKAGEVGLTVGDLLKEFIGDLVDGTYSNGSDERMYAQQWFDRLGFDRGRSKKNFLRWLLQHGDIDDFLIRHSIIEECKEDLASPEPVDSKDANIQEMNYQQKQLDKIYKEYCMDCWGWNGRVSEPCDAAVEHILKWQAELQALRGY